MISKYYDNLTCDKDTLWKFKFFTVNLTDYYVYSYILTLEHICFFVLSPRYDVFL